MVDPRTPVIVGVGQFTENIDDPSYRGMSAVDLATEAVRAALTDTGAKADDVAKAVDVVVGLRQFEISRAVCPRRSASPTTIRGRSCNASVRSPHASVIEPVGGQGPQKLVTEFANAIAAGEADVVMIIGSENGSTPAVLRQPRRQARLTRAHRRPDGRPRPPASTTTSASTPSSTG